MEPFKKMYFPIGLVLYDIPANPEEDLFFIKQLKEAQIL
jgi:hypothetical protein